MRDAYWGPASKPHPEPVLSDEAKARDRWWMLRAPRYQGHKWGDSGNICYCGATREWRNTSDPVCEGSMTTAIDGARCSECGRSDVRITKGGTLRRHLYRPVTL